VKAQNILFCSKHNYSDRLAFAIGVRWPWPVILPQLLRSFIVLLLSSERAATGRDDGGSPRGKLMGMVMKIPPIHGLKLDLRVAFSWAAPYGGAAGVEPPEGENAHGVGSHYRALTGGCAGLGRLDPGHPSVRSNYPPNMPEGEYPPPCIISWLAEPQSRGIFEPAESCRSSTNVAGRRAERLTERAKISKRL
jgi:hypothetical protein